MVELPHVCWDMGISYRYRERYPLGWLPPPSNQTKWGFQGTRMWFSNVQQVMVTLLSKKVIVGQLTIPLRGFNKEALWDLINMGIQPAIADTTGKKRVQKLGQLKLELWASIFSTNDI